MIQQSYYEKKRKSYKFHSKPKEENNLDPDDGNSRLCSACNIPIFSTPFKATESGSGYLHDQCSNLPIDLDGSDLHPSLEPLEKQPNLDESSCSKCKAVCGDVMYRCRGAECDFQLDVTCAWLVKIMHRSHDHMLMVIRCSAGFICSACGTKHRPGLSWAEPMPLVYVCSACDFWLHPHCAALPNAIQHERHRHPLLLNYRSRSRFGFRLRRSWCAICGNSGSSWGFYSCPVCGYHVDIMCAVIDDQNFEPVLFREALQENRVPELVHLPIPDEYTSIIRHIAKCTSSISDNVVQYHEYPVYSVNVVQHHEYPVYNDDVVQHQHPLTLHHEYPVYNDDDEINDDDDVHRLPTCIGCVQFISPPFYTCYRCPKLFLHDCCARLPRVVAHPPDEEGCCPVSKLIGLDIRDESSHGISETTCCNRLTNGFTYSFREYNRDIMCGLMPHSITHAAHAKTHVLRSSYVDPVGDEVAVCRCCNKFLSDISYNCTTCRNFSIHAKCARLPATVRHVYDPHPLELVTAPPPHVQTQMEAFCDACEQSLDSTQWYYGCADCEQAFHVDCVPCLDELSLIKYDIAVARVAYHKCPLTLVRGHLVLGRRCGHCGEGYRGHSLALECFKCYFSIHVSCCA